MKFLDEVKVEIYAGDGGDGSVSWRREKYLPTGGPDGGNGGSGGAVYLKADTGHNTLLSFSFNPLIEAESGSMGASNCQTGKAGKDKVISVPVGTQIFFGNELIADLDEPGCVFLAAKGGLGGRGNHSYKSASMQAPDFARPGEPGQAFKFRLVLKSVADIGLIGLPNAGKSTLISSISAARPKIASYPFTTLQPNLGSVSFDDVSFVVADIPGLIPGASDGKGLGIKFLKHIERTTALAHLLDVSPKENEEIEQSVERIKSDFHKIENELELFSKNLLSKKRVIVFTKEDVPGASEVCDEISNYFEELSFKTYLISNINRTGLNELKREFAEISRKEISEPEEIAVNASVF